MTPLFGRAAEIASIERFVAAVAAGKAAPSRTSAVMIRGDAGIGKTSLWRSAIVVAQDAGCRVLTSRCVEAEAKLSFTALGDIIDGVPDAVIGSLAIPLRRALNAALLREDAIAGPTDWRGVALAALGSIRGLSTLGPVLVAIDDVQWLDRPSARVLTFALRRLAGAPVGFIGTDRTGPLADIPGSEEHLDRQVEIAEPQATLTLTIGPLEADAIARTIKARLPGAMPDAQVDRVVRSCAGNPFFALELAAAAAHVKVGAELPVPVAIATLLRRHLERMPADARQLIAMTAMATQPTIGMAQRFFGSQTRAIEALDAAIGAGMLSIDSQRLRLSHPLLGSTACDELAARRRREIHAQLADLVADDEERATHLACAATGPDEEIAAALEKAAVHARQRGALDAAATLAERAAEITPDFDTESRSRRLVLAGEYYWHVGDMTTARLLLESAVPSIPRGPLMARALMCIGRILFHSQTSAAVTASAAALDACGDDLQLRVQAMIDLGFVTSNTAGRDAVRPMAEDALRLARELGDEDLTVQALALLAMTQAVDGDLSVRRTLDIAFEIEDRVAYLPPARTPTFISGLHALWTGEIAIARKRIEDVLQRAIDWGETSSIPDVLIQLAELETRAGNWDEAARHASAAGRLAAEESHERVQASAIGAAAMVAALRGDELACRTAAETGLAMASKTESLSAMVACESALGMLALSLGSYEETDRHLGWLSDLLVVQSYGPGVIPFIGNQIEALIWLGDLQAAGTILDHFESRARDLSNGPALTAALRCRGLIEAAHGNLAEATAAMNEALQLAERVEQPLELARTLLIQGSLLRRMRRWGDARHALTQAAERFEVLGAATWAARAYEQLERLGRRQPGPSELTSAEGRVAHLAAVGRTNREIAAELFVSVRAVEKSLTAAYRKIGVRSRTELAAWLARDGGPWPRP